MLPKAPPQNITSIDDLSLFLQPTPDGGPPRPKPFLALSVSSLMQSARTKSPSPREPEHNALEPATRQHPTSLQSRKNFKTGDMANLANLANLTLVGDSCELPKSTDSRRTPQRARSSRSDANWASSVGPRDGADPEHARLYKTPPQNQQKRDRLRARHRGPQKPRRVHQLLPTRLDRLLVDSAGVLDSCRVSISWSYFKIADFDDRLLRFPTDAGLEDAPFDRLPSRSDIECDMSRLSVAGCEWRSRRAGRGSSRFTCSEFSRSSSPDASTRANRFTTQTRIDCDGLADWRRRWGSAAFSRVHGPNSKQPPKPESVFGELRCGRRSWECPAEPRQNLLNVDIINSNVISYEEFSPFGEPDAHRLPGAPLNTFHFLCAESDRSGENPCRSMPEAGH